ncbi:MAG: hypothetical protein IJU23_01750, partial [Proteobacteria bacterium]|nr:hypothetical protein [Pseudomonadota bacterium]
MVSILALALAGCQSGGGTEPAQSAAEQVDDGLCHGPDGAVDCHGATCVNGECLECLNNTQCEDPNKPACHAHKCEPCSGANDCSVGSCDTKSGQCVECLADDDCESVSSDGHVTNSNVWGHIDHSFGTAPRTMCVEHQCVACNVSTCMGTCVDGRCNARKTTNCEGNACEFSPTTIGDIAPETRGLADAVRLFRLAVPNVSAQETAPTVEAYSVDAWVNGMVATVTTEFVIFNPNARAMEGTLEFPLPDDAVVSGYAIDVDGMMMDAQVVDKQNARMAYENEVKKGVDPGLVEQMKGNAYRTRIYPIPAQGGRRVRVEYTTPLMVAPNGDAALALPMPNTQLKQRDIKISVVAQGVPAPAVGGLGDTRFAKAQAVWVVDSHETDVNPRENVLVAMPSLPDTVVSTETFRGDRFFMASMKVSNDAVKKELPQKYRVIWDASGSRSKEDIDKARAFIEHLPENGTYELHVFRNVLEPAKTLTGRAKLLAALDRIVYDGGTDFSPLEKIASKKFEGMTLFFTDGMDTFTGALPQFGTNSIAVMSGAARDVSSMRKICSGRTINLDAVNGDEAVRQILNAPLMASEVTGSGLSHIEGLGKPVVGRVTLVGRIEPGTTEATVVMSNGDKIAIQFPSEPPAEGKAIAKSWAARRIDDLSPRAEDNRDELLALGRMFSIVSPVSSMIVFENLSQWLEYDIEPPENSPLHDKWLAQRKSSAERASEKNVEEEVWQENFDDLWDLRLAWYNEPKSKVKYKTPVKKKPRRNLD